MGARYGQKTIKTERELRLPSHYLWQPNIENICSTWLKSVHCSQQRCRRETFGNPTMLNATTASNMLFKRQMNKRDKAKNLSFSLFLIQKEIMMRTIFLFLQMQCRLSIASSPSCSILTGLNPKVFSAKSSRAR